MQDWQAACLDKDAVIARLQGELSRLQRRDALQSQATAALQVSGTAAMKGADLQVTLQAYHVVWP